MSQVLIQQYLNQLQDLRKVSGTHRESVVREAFKDLLKGWARSHDLIFVPEYEIATPAKDRRYVDGALVHALRVPFGYWEAMWSSSRAAEVAANTALESLLNPPRLLLWLALFFADLRNISDFFAAVITNRLGNL